MTGKVLEGASTSERKALVIKLVQFIVISHELYRMGADGILRRCVPMSARYLVISESHTGDAGGHFTANITSKKSFSSGTMVNNLAQRREDILQTV